MKKFTILLLFVLAAYFGFAQGDTATVTVGKKNVVTVIEDSVKVQVKVGEDKGVEVITNQMGDTVSIRIGRRKFEVIDDTDGTKFRTSKKERESEEDKFNGHWAGFGLGVNTFHTTDYSLYNGMGYGDFFDLHHAKSLTVNLNFAEYTFSDRSNTIGLITGLGFSLMDFRFDNPITVVKSPENGILIPQQLEQPGLKKSKLNVSYLTAPLILEIATPLRFNQHRLTIGGGVIGGINIGSRTKIKTDEGKSKYRRNFNVAPLKYELTGRLGLGEVCLFVNYGMTPVFKDGKGPELVPLTVGIAFPNVSF